MVTVEDVARTIHALPKARVSAGKNFIETVEEGEHPDFPSAFEDGSDAKWV